MSTYDRVANICVACGVLSALLFERAGGLRPVIGGLGVLAGAAAVAVYLRAHWPAGTADEGTEETSVLGNQTPMLGSAVEVKPAFLPETDFLAALVKERKRAERFGEHFVLALIESPGAFEGKRGLQVIPRVGAALAASIREVDLGGWYRQGHTVGVIFPGVRGEIGTTLAALNNKLQAALRGQLRPQDEISVSFHLFPEASDRDDRQAPEDSVLYPDVRQRVASRSVPHAIKRLIDIGSSAVVLALSSPVFLLIAAAIKLTSRGPVLYRQVRVGQFGRRFTFLRFRSMYVNSSAAVHQEYVKSLIRGESKSHQAGGAPGAVYKIRHDPRVTPLGRILRKTSLDDLPQFFNVLKGDMSLVGPRPPIPYELEAYDTWHRRRLLEARPGLTGLWQVSGRSRTTFDEMVRLDLRYATGWSLWLDLRILAKTPRAVLSGEGAY